jgi:hypothetical protein
MKPAPIPANRLEAPDPDRFFDLCTAPNNLVHFLINVGDGDTQLVLLPRMGGGPRRAIVVDVSGGQKAKLPGLVASLQQAGILAPPQADNSTPAHRKAFPIVVGTHPHDDHIGGMADFIDLFRFDIAAYWDAGYYLPSGAFIETMEALEQNPHIAWAQPASGLSQFIDDVRMLVLGPGITLKHQYDSYGVDPNNASITLKFEYPYKRVQVRSERVASEAVKQKEQLSGRLYAKVRSVKSLVLGGDAQAREWAQTQVDHPKLESKFSPIFHELKMARGIDPLNATVFKVSHHASKRGIHLELLEALSPGISLVSSVGGGGKHGFPHQVAQEAIREAKEKIAKTGQNRSADHKLNIYYTSDTRAGAVSLGTIATVIPASGSVQLWRFEDERDELVDLNKARFLKQP